VSWNVDTFFCLQTRDRHASPDYRASTTTSPSRYCLCRPKNIEPRLFSVPAGAQEISIFGEAEL